MLFFMRRLLPLKRPREALLSLTRVRARDWKGRECVCVCELARVQSHRRVLNPEYRDRDNRSSVNRAKSELERDTSVVDEMKRGNREWISVSFPRYNVY